jgi:hypothetical protein
MNVMYESRAYLLLVITTVHYAVQALLDDWSLLSLTPVALDV